MICFHCIKNSQSLSLTHIFTLLIIFKMEKSSRSMSSLVLFMLVLLATEMGPMTVEGRTCDTKSSEYKGICLFDTNCDSICKIELGFDGRHCHGFFRRCYCTKPC
ncbi:hypothetical protein ES288_D01G048500v1 [Gossypium darwinii]|uniref:Knottins-like domain-containing protein n=1 Tax=Gossypium darwinii TaxID=34276 RepID=A0A5D2DK52_GOSDA|nr:hypothetical protein ES288_D01G048500v1 [Gossypium darwinii]